MYKYQNKFLHEVFSRKQQPKLVISITSCLRQSIQTVPGSIPGSDSSEPLILMHASAKHAWLFFVPNFNLLWIWINGIWIGNRSLEYMGVFHCAGVLFRELMKK